MTAARPYSRVAVLDIGKTNAKVVVLDSATGMEVAMRRTSNAVLKTGPYPHYDIEHLWNFAIEAFAAFAVSPGFDAISITTHGASMALLAADGDLALPVLDYEHLYPQAVVADYDRIRPAFSETFSPRLSGGLNAGAQIHYQKSEFPDDFARVAVIMTYPQYWAWRLTGVAANEVTSLGCHTDLWMPRSGCYSTLVDRLEIGQLMAPVRSAFDALGTVLPDIAARIGLTEPVPVFCGIHDSNASLLPHLIANEVPFAVVSTGTWVVNFAVGGDLDHLDPTRDTLVNVDAYGRAVPSSRFMGGREFEILCNEIGAVDHQDVLASLEAVLDKGVMLLPNVVQGSGPFPGRACRWLGALDATAGERLAAGNLYLALMTEACLGLIGAKGAIFVEGPFALNPIYLSALSQFTGRDVIALPGSTGTSQGAALLAAIEGPAEAQHVTVAAEIAGLEDYRRAWYRALEDA